MLTTKDVQNLLGVSRRTVRDLIAKGRLIAASDGPGRGRHLHYDTNSVLREMRRRRQAS